MTETKQELFIQYMLSSTQLMAKILPILKRQYFDRSLQDVVGYIQQHYEKYKALPTADQVKAETTRVFNPKDQLSKAEIEYGTNEIETFCRNKAMENAILSSPDLLQKGDYGSIERLIKEAINVSVQRNLGLDYFYDPEARLSTDDVVGQYLSTGIDQLDDFLDGGIRRKEMLIYSAPPGVGKSIHLLNTAKKAVADNYRAIYITLELAEEVVARRADTMFTGVPKDEVKRRITEVSTKIMQFGKPNSLRIVRMPASTTNSSHIRAYIREYQLTYGYLPDLLCLDYLDLMDSNVAVSAENIHLKDKYKSEELRELGNEFDMAIATASQLGRGALTAKQEDIGQEHTAGGISKVNTTDNMVAIIQNDKLRAEGRYFYKMLKTRSTGAVGRTFYSRIDPVTLVISSDMGEMIGNQLKKPPMLTNTPASLSDLKSLRRRV